ncbi:MAG: DNA repair protein RadC [Treponema sp.]|jgi:DNA repair protein RadC|nr:DNA repair protein RadC [Treponema sp.]
MKQQIAIKKPTDILPLLSKWKKRREENFLTVTLNGAHEVIKVHHITKSLLNKTIIHPRECFYPTVRDYASAVILVHNHPCGRAISNADDDNVTHRLCMAGLILGITVLDHIIITPRDDIYSYRQAKKITDDFSSRKQIRFIKKLTAEEKGTGEIMKEKKYELYK